MRLISEFNNGCENTSASEKVGWCGRALRLKKSKSVNYKNKGSPGHFTVEINVGKRRIRHTTTLALNHQFLDRLKIDRKSKFRLVFMSDPSPSDVSFKNKMTTFTLEKNKQNTHQKAESATRLIRMLHNRCSVLCSSCPSQNLTKSHF